MLRAEWVLRKGGNGGALVRQAVGGQTCSSGDAQPSFTLKRSEECFLSRDDSTGTARVLACTASDTAAV